MIQFRALALLLALTGPVLAQEAPKAIPVIVADVREAVPELVAALGRGRPHAG